MNWDKYYHYFQPKEFTCSHTGELHMQSEFMDKLLALRLELNRPMIISSGYRDPSHPLERNKASRGVHTYGVACDVRVYGEGAWHVAGLAYKHGITGIGISQKDSHNTRFIHLDTGNPQEFPRPWMYSY